MHKIKCISLGNPDIGFKNYFMHEDCFDRLLLKLTNVQIKAFQLDTWQDYSGQQFTDRNCVMCSAQIDEEPKLTSTPL